ncbi:MAG: hypothetical protein LBT27_08400 [Prevotellaceae bacterium]|nr:hypothetical protein [Prevotellaceae bacterium]
MMPTQQKSPHTTAEQFIIYNNFHLIIQQNHNKKSCYFVTIPKYNDQRPNTNDQIPTTKYQRPNTNDQIPTTKYQRLNPND